MKNISYLLTLALVLFLATTIPVVAYGAGFHHGGHGFHDRGHGFHHRGHVFFTGDIFIGPGWGWGPWWGYPYYPYYPYYPNYYEPMSRSTEYIQKEPTQEENSYYWYFCGKPEGYYPYVKKCPGGWQKVVPAPPPE